MSETAPRTGRSRGIVAAVAAVGALACAPAVHAQRAEPDAGVEGEPETEPEPGAGTERDGPSEEEIEALEQELAAELGAQGEQAGDADASAADAGSASTQPPAGSGSGVSGTDLGRVMLLPDISAVLTAGVWYFSDEPTPRFPAHEPSHTRDGFRFQLQELELALQAAIDPCVEADIFFALGLLSFEIEEAYLTTLSLPASLQARAGWMYASFGRFNTRHFLVISEPWYDAETARTVASRSGAELVRLPGDVGAGGVDSYGELIDAIVSELARAFE